MVYLKRDIMEALKRSDEKLESYSRKTDERIESYSTKADERMDDFSRKADEMLEKFMLVTNTVGSQIKFNQLDERITNMERKILDMDENMSTEVKITKKNM